MNCIRTAAAFVGLCISLVHGQACTATGAFQPASPAFHIGNNFFGFSIQGNTIIIDSDRDGTASATDPGDKVFPLPATLIGSGSSAPLNVALSPTQEFLFAAGGQPTLTSGPCGTPGQRVRFFRIPVSAGAPLELIVDDCLPCQGLDGGRPLWYDLGETQGGFAGQPPAPNAAHVSSLRYAYIRTSTGNFGCGSPNSQPRIRFYDLDTGITATRELGLQPGVGDVTISPGGEFMMIQHDLTSNPTDSDVDVLRLCNLATIEQVQGLPPTINDMSIPGINAHVVSSSGGEATIEVRDGTSAVRWAGTSACCSTGAPTGACCTGTSCSITTQAACGGVWSAGLTCAQVGCGATPPTADAVINAPASMQVNTITPVSVVVTNSGGTAASNVRVTLATPSAQILFFSSAGQGGVIAGFNPGVVTWNLPTIAAGASTTLTAQLNSTCWTGPQTLTATTSATGIAARTFTQSVTVQALATAPVTVTSTSVPSVTPPLKADDTVTHTLVLTNTASFEQNATMSFPAGNYAVFDRIDSCGGGTCQISGGSTFMWSGTMAPQQTLTFVLTTRMTDCFNPSFGRTGLANGGFIYVMGPCNTVLGTTPGGQTMFSVAPAVYGILEAINVQPGTIGTADTGGAPAGGPTFQLFRGVPPLQMRATFHNTLNRALDLGALTISLPSDWTITSGPTNGASHDIDFGQLTFSGTIPANGSINFEFGATCADLEQSGSLSLNRQTPTCSAGIGGFEAIVMPPVPSGPYVMALNNFFDKNLSLLERGVDTQLHPIFGETSFWTGLAPGANGDLWLIGRSLTRFNFGTLEIESFAQALDCASGRLLDGAFQPSTGDLILYSRVENAATGTLMRFNPSTRVCTIIATDIPSSIRQSNENEVLVEPSGDILVSNHDVLLRFNAGATGPLPPNSGQSVQIPGPTYSIANSGPATAQHIWSVVPLCTGLWSVVHATDFMTPTVGTPSRVFAVSLWDPATGQTTVVDPLFAGEGYSPFGGWNIGQSVAPTFTVTHPYPVELSSASMIEGEPGEVLFGTANYPSFEVSALDPVTGALTFLQSPLEWQFVAAMDVAYFQPASTTCGSGFCAADFNQDGGVDIQDVDAFFAAWQAGDALSDVNMDGGVDGADVGAFFDLWQAGGC